jgi:hypothetical protein
MLQENEGGVFTRANSDSAEWLAWNHMMSFMNGDDIYRDPADFLADYDIVVVDGGYYVLPKGFVDEHG